MSARALAVLGLAMALLLAATANGADTAVPAAVGEQAAESVQELSPQQQRMKDCAALAREKALRGAARRAFFSSCLSGGQVQVEFGAVDSTIEAAEPIAPSEAPPATSETIQKAPGNQGPAAKPQRSEAERLAFKKRLGACLEQLRQEPKTGAERKAFMQQCLTADAAAAP